MTLFDVYDRYDVSLTHGKGCWVYDQNSSAYLDLYGGHAVISVGHGHPYYLQRLQEQLNQLGYYSNAVHFPIQEALAASLGRVSRHENYQLFLCNSGAEANENALKLASFHTGRSGVIAFKKGFHGRTSAAVMATDNSGIQAPVNQTSGNFKILDWNDMDLVQKEIEKETTCAVLIETIQGVGGLEEVPEGVFKALEILCKKHGTLLIADEIQSGFGRTGDFFAFSKHNVQPDIITIAKGMGNGFPVAGVLIGPHISPKKGMLGTTFGGNPLACAAVIGVLEILEKENLIDHVRELSSYLDKQLPKIQGLSGNNGRGLMRGLLVPGDSGTIRKRLVTEKNIFTGGSANKQLIRILPPLTISKQELDHFLIAISEILKKTYDENHLVS